jgi:hypothetical protein
VSEDHQIAVIADRVSAVLRSHVDAMADRAVATAEKSFMHQIELLQQRIGELERDVAELRAKK